MRNSITAASSEPEKRPASKIQSFPRALILSRGGSIKRMDRHTASSRCQARVMGICLAVLAGFMGPAEGQQVKFDADDWFSECGALPDSDCSIIGVFRNSDPAGPKASFSLLVDLRNRMVAIIGKPPPSKATIRVDKNQAFECQGSEYCIFSVSDSEAIARQLKSGSLVLVDVVAGANFLRASISAKGYQTDLGKIRAQGFRGLLE
jgi:hypothetical protein